MVSPRLCLLPAARTTGEDCALGDESPCKQHSHFLVVDSTTGNVLMEELTPPGEQAKYDHVDFVKMCGPV